MTLRPMDLTPQEFEAWLIARGDSKVGISAPWIDMRDQDVQQHVLLNYVNSEYDPAVHIHPFEHEINRISWCLRFREALVAKFPPSLRTDMSPLGDIHATPIHRSVSAVQCLKILHEVCPELRKPDPVIKRYTYTTRSMGYIAEEDCDVMVGYTCWKAYKGDLIEVEEYGVEVYGIQRAGTFEEIGEDDEICPE